METRCKPGDLAVVVDAFNANNIGTIVLIVAPHDGTGELVYRTDQPVWLVSSYRHMTWTIKDQIFLLKEGPVPDSQLQPIRGVPNDEQTTAAFDAFLQALKPSSKTLTEFEQAHSVS